MQEVAYIEITKIQLDQQNPREGQLELSQNEKLQLYAQDVKTLELAKHLAEHGLNPSESLIVIPREGYRESYTVVEGNRRVSAIKLLLHPTVIDGPTIQKRFQSAASAVNPSDWKKVPCYVAQNREEANTWIDVKHGGEQEGVGVVPWNPAERARYDELQNRPNRNLTAMRLIEYAQKSRLIDNSVRQQADSRITTLSRLTDDRQFKDQLLRLSEGASELMTTLPKSQFDKALKRVILDIVNKSENSRTLHTSKHRHDYIGRVIQKESVDTEKKLKNPRVVYRSGNVLVKPRPSKPRVRNKLIEEFQSQINNSRTAAIVQELKGLNVQKYPNACAVLLRLTIEMVVENYLDFQKIKYGHRMPLRKKLGKVIQHMDKNQLIGESKLKAATTLAETQRGLFSIDALHQYVHNPEMRPPSGDLIAYWDSIEPFIKVAINNSQ